MQALITIDRFLKVKDMPPGIDRDSHAATASVTALCMNELVMAYNFALLIEAPSIQRPYIAQVINKAEANGQEELANEIRKKQLPISQ